MNTEIYIYKKNQLEAIQEVDGWSQSQLETLLEILREQGKTIKIKGRKVNHERLRNCYRSNH